MRIVILSFIFIAVFHLAASAPVENVDAQWEKYKVDFNKKYNSSAEEARRKQIFVKSLEDVEAINLKYEQGLVPWTSRITQFSDWTSDEFKKIQGILQYNRDGLHQ